MFVMFIIILLLTNIDLSDSLYIISRGKPVEFCNTSLTTLTDGDRTTTYIFESIKGCYYKFELSLGVSHFIKHVILFTGKTGNVSSNHVFDSIGVRCLIGNYFESCAELSTQISMIKHIEKGIRLNLLYENMSAVEIFFLVDLNKEVSLSEIEVYAREADDIIHRGCFANVSSKKSFTFDDLNRCQQACNRSSFGISKPLSSCFCFDKIIFENEVSLSECNATCRDSNNKCGGSNSHSVYIQEYYIPVFIGCFHKESFILEPHSPNGLKLDVIIRNLTFSKCARYCGLTNSFYSGGNCNCAKLGPTSYPFPPCDIPCEFDEEIACGGENKVSLYRYCGLRINNPIYCDKLLNCKRAVFNHNGVCTHGCKSGFEGEHCMLKVSDPIPGEIEEPDEVIEVLDDSGAFSKVTSPVTEESIDTVTSPDIQEGSEPKMDDDNVITKPSKSVGAMVNFFSIIETAAIFLVILF